MAGARRTPPQRWESLVRASLAEAAGAESHADAPAAEPSDATDAAATDPATDPVALDDLIAKAVSEVDRHAAGARRSRAQLERLRSRAAASLKDAGRSGAQPVAEQPPVAGRHGLDLRR